LRKNLRLPRRSRVMSRPDGWKHARGKSVSRRRRDGFHIDAVSCFAFDSVCHATPGHRALKVTISLKFVGGLTRVIVCRFSMSTHQIARVDFDGVILLWHPHFVLNPY